MTLSKNEQVQLSELYQGPGYPVLKKVFEAKIIDLGLDAINSRTVEFTAELRGQKIAIEWIHKFIKENEKQRNNAQN